MSHVSVSVPCLALSKKVSCHYISGTNVPVSKGHVAPSNFRNDHVPMSILRVEGNRDIGITKAHMDSVTVNSIDETWRSP